MTAYTYVVDTNVPIVANGRADGGSLPSKTCRLAAVEFLSSLVAKGRTVLDLAGAIQEEYRRYLNPRGQPGVGDRFYLEVINSTPKRILRVNLPTNADGSYKDFPRDASLRAFDQSDRKFAALARRRKVPVANATDSDWLDFKAALSAHHIEVKFVCGCDKTHWFTAAPTPKGTRKGRRNKVKSK